MFIVIVPIFPSAEIPAPLTLNSIESLGAFSTAVPSALTSEKPSLSNFPLSPSTAELNSGSTAMSVFEWLVTAMVLVSADHLPSVLSYLCVSGFHSLSPSVYVNVMSSHVMSYL